MAILFGDTKTDFDSYLRPIISSLDRMSREPLIIKKNGVHVTSANVYNLGVIADGIEINQRLLMFGGHMNWYGCRFCLGKCSVDWNINIDINKLFFYFFN